MSKNNQKVNYLIYIYIIVLFKFVLIILPSEIAKRYYLVECKFRVNSLANELVEKVIKYSLNNSFLSINAINVSLKIFIFIFEILTMCYIYKLVKGYRKYIATLFFASPMIIYINYIEGDTGIISLFFLISSIYYTVNKNSKKLNIAGFFLGWAILLDFSCIVYLPLFVIYVYKSTKTKIAIKPLFITILTFTIPIVLLEKISDVNNYSLNAILVKLSNNMYGVVAVCIVVYICMLYITTLTKDVYIYCYAILSAAQVVLTSNIYSLILRMITLYVIYCVSIKYKRAKNIVLILLLNLAYFVQILNKHQVIIVEENILSTTLITIQILMIIFMFYFGIITNRVFRSLQTPFIIGITGDSGTGKSTFMNLVQNCLGVDNILLIEGDGDHKWERGEKKWNEYTHLNPKANFLYRQAWDLKQLRLGNIVHRVDYNHITGKFSEEKKIKPKKYIMLCGLHSLYLPQTRNALDLKIYMDTDESLRKYWKIQRDIKSRGYCIDDILKQIEIRKEDAEKYIYPQKEYADFIIHLYDKTLESCKDDNHELQISLKVMLNSAVNIEVLVNKLKEYNINTTYDYYDNMFMQYIDVDYKEMSNKELPIKKIGHEIIPYFEEIWDGVEENVSANQGIIMIVLMLLISNKLMENL